jgi:hypothetical protein
MEMENKSEQGGGDLDRSRRDDVTDVRNGSILARLLWFGGRYNLSIQLGYRLDRTPHSHLARTNMPNLRWEYHIL